MAKIVSIIITHFSSGEARSKSIKQTIKTLTETVNMPYELIVVDNGGNIEDSKYLLELTDKGIINTYIRNHNNMHFGYARNQALRLCIGDYIVISDNDIVYNPGWLDKCIAVLEAHPDKKIYATPIYNVTHWRPKYWQGELKVGDDTYKLNMRAGSNCWVTRRKDFEEIGDFLIHRIAGSKWTNRAVALGYLAAVTPDIMVNDEGFRRGYNINESLPVKLDLHHGEVYFNHDEFCSHPDNKDKQYVRQITFKKHGN